MAIVKMLKLTLAAPQAERDGILHLLQQKGSVQLVDLTEKLLTENEDVSNEFHGAAGYESTTILSQAENDYNSIKFTYEFLEDYSDRKKGMLDRRQILKREEFDKLEENIDWKAAAEQCRALEEALNNNKSKKTKLLSQLEQYKNWCRLDVSISELDSMKNAAYFLGTVSRRYEEQLHSDFKDLPYDVYVENVGEKQQDINIFVLCHISEANQISDILKKYGFSRLNLDISEMPSKQIDILNDELNALEVEHSNFTEQAVSLAKGIEDIEKVFDYKQACLDRQKAVLNLVKTGKTFVLGGSSSSEGSSMLM
jgi:V/A-type H+-transporting ATPase subunit I